MQIDDRVLEELIVKALYECGEHHAFHGGEADHFFGWIEVWAQNSTLAPIVRKATVKYLGYYGDKHWTWRIVFGDEAHQIFSPQQLLRLQRRATCHSAIRELATEDPRSSLARRKERAFAELADCPGLFSLQEGQERYNAFCEMLSL